MTILENGNLTSHETIGLRQQQQQAHSSSNMSTTSVDWSNSSPARDVSIYSGTDSDEFDPSMLKFSDEELRPQPILRKSKKVRERLQQIV